MKTLKKVTLKTSKGLPKSGAELNLEGKIFSQARKCKSTGKAYVVCDVDSSNIDGICDLAILDSREIMLQAKSGLLSFDIDKETTTNKAIYGTETEIKIYFDASSKKTNRS